MLSSETTVDELREELRAWEARTGVKTAPDSLAIVAASNYLSGKYPNIPFRGLVTTEHMLPTAIFLGILTLQEMNSSGLNHLLALRLAEDLRMGIVGQKQVRSDIAQSGFALYGETKTLVHFSARESWKIALENIPNRTRGHVPVLSGLRTLFTSINQADQEYAFRQMFGPGEVTAGSTQRRIKVTREDEAYSLVPQMRFEVSSIWR